MRSKELIESPKPRISVAMCIDVGGSVTWSHEYNLNRAVKEFYSALCSDENGGNFELCIIAFSNKATLMQNFMPVEKNVSLPKLSVCSRKKHIGAGVNMALDMLEQRKREYKEIGIDYCQPWLVLITDGVPAGEDRKTTEKAIKRTRDLVLSRQLSVYPICIDSSVLPAFSPRCPLLYLHDTGDATENYLSISKNFEYIDWNTSPDWIPSSEPKDFEKWWPIQE